MEVIHLAGYILQEKVEIARRYLVPKQLRAHGATRAQFDFTLPALREIVNGSAREPGVRSLEQSIRKIIRKGVRQIVGGRRRRVTVDARHLTGLLGKRVFTDESAMKRTVPGVAMGLAWTSLGGDTLFVEAASVETGTPGFKQTGQLGNVMVESSEIAYTYVRSILNRDARCREFFKKNYVHLHVPAGATPKDGPSAGITMAIALYSLVTRRAVRPGIAMTGELTLTGRVMPIGGVKEKTIAARRANVRRLVFPARNRKDFEELPAHIRRGLQPVFVSTFRDALAACVPGGA
jgi:ATP-dependent Lon protease